MDTRWIRRARLAMAALGLAAVTGSALAVKTQGTAEGFLESAFATQTDPFATNATAFTNVTGSSVKITIPDGQQGYIRARFSAETTCGGELSNGVLQTCSVRILVGTTSMRPASQADFVFDSSNQCCSDATPEAHAMERVSDLLPAGSYTIKVQASVGNASTQFNIDDWMLSAEVLPVPPT
jgi:hypothetical protein